MLYVNKLMFYIIFLRHSDNLDPKCVYTLSMFVYLKTISLNQNIIIPRFDLQLANLKKYYSLIPKYMMNVRFFCCPNHSDTLNQYRIFPHFGLPGNVAKSAYRMAKNANSYQF